MTVLRTLPPRRRTGSGGEASMQQLPASKIVLRHIAGRGTKRCAGRNKQCRLGWRGDGAGMGGGAKLRQCGGDWRAIRGAGRSAVAFRAIDSPGAALPISTAADRPDHAAIAVRRARPLGRLPGCGKRPIAPSAGSRCHRQLPFCKCAANTLSALRQKSFTAATFALPRGHNSNCYENLEHIGSLS